MTLATNVLTKQPTETRLMTMSFSSSMAVGETIVSIDNMSTTPAGVTLGATSTLPQSAALLISGGTDNKKYKIQIKITTSLGQVLENEGYLEVRDI